MKRKITRRKFVKTSLASAAAISVAPAIASSASLKNPYDSKGLPTRVLGKTGVQVPLLGFGCGSRWMAIENDDKALAILEHALNNGVYYWDTAAQYGNKNISSEERIGEILGPRRTEVFLTSKVRDRDGDAAKASIERSLKRLKTDHIDLLQLHAIQSVDDAEEIGKKGKILEVMQGYKDQGIVKHIGFSGHTSAAAMKKAVELYDFDVMMIAMNHRRPDQPFEEQAIPFAANKGLGIVAMKVVRPRESVEGLGADKLLRYALSLKYISLANIGTDSMDVLNANLETVRNFKSLNENEMKEMDVALNPFFQHKNIPWMNPGYVDGIVGGVKLA